MNINEVLQAIRNAMVKESRPAGSHWAAVAYAYDKVARNVVKELIDAGLLNLHTVKPDNESFDAHDMTTASADGFRDGQAAVPEDVRRDAERYRWLRIHFKFANDSTREIWFDGDTLVDEPGELDDSIDAAMAARPQGKGQAVMHKSAYRLALADAMQLHDERVRQAIDNVRRLRDELDAAEKHQRFVMQARSTFKGAIAAQEVSNA